MKQRFFPVVLTAALTSVATIFAVGRFQNRNMFIGGNNNPVPVSYVAYNPESSPVLKTPPVDFQHAAESSVKAVVHIKTTTNSRTVLTRDPLAELFGEDNYYRRYRTPEQMGSGSGVVISPDGYIVTNNHVVSGTDIVTVTFNDRNSVQAKVVGSDPSTDLAVLKIDEKDLSFIEFGNSDDVHLGQWVLAVGYPLTLDATVTAGIVSAKGRSIGINATRSRGAIESFIQTDAVVNPGNSGGPLVNDRGQVIGINSAIASPTGSYAGYSYAIPANIVRKVAADIIQYGAVQRAYLGIEPRDYKNATAQEIARYGLNKSEGIYVVNAAPLGGAAAAGIRSGDFITAVNNVKVSTIPQLNEQLSRFKPGDKVPVSYLRSGAVTTVNVELKNIKGNTSVIKEEGALMVLGASLRPLSTNEQRLYKIMKGLVITDVGNGLLKNQTTVRKGFIISGVNGKPVSDAASLDRSLASGEPLQLEGFYPGSNGMYYYNINTGAGEEP